MRDSRTWFAVGVGCVLLFVLSYVFVRQSAAFEDLGILFKWKKPVVGVSLHPASCLDDDPDNPVGTALELNRGVRGAITTWENTGANLHFDFVGESSFDLPGVWMSDPVPVYCRTRDEDSHWDENPGSIMHAPCGTVPDPLGGFPFGKIDACAVVILQDDATTFGFRRGEIFGPANFMNFITHEFGHVAGLDHSELDEFGILNEALSPRSIVTEDDQLGFLNRAGGTNRKALQTARATLAGTNLIFEGSPESLFGANFQTMASPSASGNPLGSDGDFDYAIAYLQPQACITSCPPGSESHERRRIVVSTFNESPSKDLEVVGTFETPFFSTEPPSIAVGRESPGGIGIAYTSTGTGLDRELHFAVTSDVTEPTAWDDVNLHRTPIGAPTLTYSSRKSRWVIAWIQFNTGGSFSNQYKIGTIVSSDFTGLDWVATGRTYDDSLSMHHGMPSMACSQNENRCVLIYNQFESPDISQIHQRAFQFNEPRTHMDSLDTFPAAGDQTYGGIDITRWEQGYLYTNIIASGKKDAMRFHVKADFDTTEIGPWSESLAGQNSAIQSRGRVASAYNWRTGDFRFFWIP